MRCGANMRLAILSISWRHSSVKMGRRRHWQPTRGSNNPSGIRLLAGQPGRVPRVHLRPRTTEYPEPSAFSIQVSARFRRDLVRPVTGLDAPGSSDYNSGMDDKKKERVFEHPESPMSLSDHAFLEELGISGLPSGLAFALREHQAVLERMKNVEGRADGLQALELDEKTLERLSREQNKPIEELRRELRFFRDLDSEEDP